MTAVSQLSPAAKAKIKLLSGPRPARFLATLTTTWLTIAISVYIAVLLQNVFVSLISIYIIATRQNLLALLIHEQTHYLGLRSRIGDSFVNCLASYPLMAITVEGYAKVHLAHHRFYFTSRDPDFGRKKGVDWTFPMGALKLLSLFLCDISGLSFVRHILRGNNSEAIDPTAFKRKHPSPKWLKLSFFASAAVLLSVTQGWIYFLVYWVVPLVTVLPVIVRWSAICEHSYGHEGATVEETSPVILPTYLSRILLPNLNFTMHVYHHYFPGVSFSALPKVHDIFVEERLVREDQVFSGHLDYLRYITKSARAAQARIGEAGVSVAA
jgi:fatty acid desaturase